MNWFLKLLVPLAALAMSGCLSYTWTSSVPQELRTVSVPTFRNESDVTELGPIVSRQILREFQREGTFRLASAGEAAIEIQGIIKTAGSSVTAYNVRSSRHREYAFKVTANVSFIDKKSGRVLVDNRLYTARTTYLGGHDSMTGARDASGRAAEDLAQQIVDDALSFDYLNEKEGANHE